MCQRAGMASAVQRTLNKQEEKNMKKTRVVMSAQRRQQRISVTQTLSGASNLETKTDLNKEVG